MGYERLIESILLSGGQLWGGTRGKANVDWGAKFSEGGVRHGTQWLENEGKYETQWGVRTNSDFKRLRDDRGGVGPRREIRRREFDWREGYGIELLLSGETPIELGKCDLMV